ncbi:MAG TPA: helix-turn-helix domain-containing protein [Hymenobacter sp.]
MPRMPIVSSTLGPDYDEELVNVTRALAHPVRLAIVRLLSDRKRRLSGEITSAIPLPRTTVSQHLTALHNSALLEAEVKGLTIAYWLNPKVAPTALRHLSYFCTGICRCPVCEQGAECDCFVDGIQRLFRQ